jgi:hypothetical protein
MKSFENWTIDDLYYEFGIDKENTMPELAHWLNYTADNSAEENIAIAKLYDRIVYNIDGWNEDELKSFFIIPLVDVVHFERIKAYKSFTQRTIEGKIKNLKGVLMSLRGRVEFLVARGIQIPREPFFFLHEYKPQKGTNNDPHGQLLSAMLVAQAQNNDFDTPLYGIVVIGRNWFFVVLRGTIYAMSDTLVATNRAHLAQIVTRLKFVKNSIEEHFTNIG